MAAKSEWDTLEQVLKGFVGQKLRLQVFIQDWVQEQERLIEHATPICLERNAELDSANNSFIQKSELGDFRQHSEDEAVVRDHATLSAKVSREDELISNGVTHSSRAKVSQTLVKSVVSPAPSRKSMVSYDPRGAEVDEIQFPGQGLGDVSQFSVRTSADLDHIRNAGRNVHSAIGLYENGSSCTSLDSVASSYDRVSKILTGESPAVSTARAREDSSSLSIVTRIVDSGKFDLFVAVVIFTNSVAMGISADYSMNNLHGQDNDVLAIFELLFRICYTIEVLLRIVGYGKTFFTGSLWRWNMFDFLLVVLAGSDRVHCAIGCEDKGSEGRKLSILRILRLLKMLRLLRIFRLLMFFRELRLILAGLLGAVQSMLWTVLLIMLISYMVAIGLVEGCVAYSEDSRVDIDIERGIEEYWSSVGTSMISLFMCTKGGEDWATFSAPLEEVGTLFYALLLLYMSFFIFALMNTTTSLFVDSIMETSSKDHHMTIQMELEKRHHSKVASFF